MEENNIIEAEENTIIENESKAAKFIRLGESRTSKVLERIALLDNLSNRDSYEYTPEQVEFMFSVVEDALMTAKAHFFEVPKDKKGFSFSGNQA